MSAIVEVPVTPENYTGYPLAACASGPVSVLSLTVRSTTSGPQMLPTPASPAVKVLLAIVRPDAPATPTETPIVA